MSTWDDDDEGSRWYADGHKGGLRGFVDEDGWTLTLGETHIGGHEAASLADAREQCDSAAAAYVFIALAKCAAAWAERIDAQRAREYRDAFNERERTYAAYYALPCGDYGVRAAREAWDRAAVRAAAAHNRLVRGVS